MPETQNSNSRNTLKLILFIVLTGAIAAGLAGVYMAEKPASQSGQTTPLSLETEKAYDRILAQYRCPCGSCELDLAGCACGTAVAVRKDTRQRLSREKVIERTDIRWILENIHKAQPIS